MSLIPIFPGRPVTVAKDGWTLYVSVRDQAYLHGKRDWKQKLVAAHPDKGGSHAGFLNVRRAFDRWREAEARWYEQIRLLPPDGWVPNPQTRRFRPALRTRRVELTCERCGRAFAVPRHLTGLRFCSWICANAAVTVIKTRSNIGKPVIDLGGDDRKGA